jgi:DNA gyrase subunit A
MGKRTPIDQYPVKGRATMGVITRDVKDGDLLAGALTVDEGDDVMVITEGGIITRMPVVQIRRTGRIAIGVRVQRVEEGDQIAAVALVPEEEQVAEELGEAAAADGAPDGEAGDGAAPGSTATAEPITGDDVIPPEDVAVGAGVGEPPEDVEAATDDSEAGSAPEQEPEPEPDGE